jgi:hypothetical protein
MHRRALVLLTFGALLVATACGSSGSKHSTGSTATATAGATSSRQSSATSTTAASSTPGPNPNAPEVSPAGDIPDNQVFVRYTPRAPVYSVVVPEGWARTETRAVATFTNDFNTIRIESDSKGAATTAADARATDVPELQRNAPGFNLGNVNVVQRSAGPVLLITYQANSPADSVTGKSVVLDVERYEYWRNGTRVTITLSAPHGSDNVDPWRKVTDSFAWSA